jgi:predicted glycosyltransferase
MKILVDINHPAHVHYFKNCIKLLRQKAHQIIITARDRYPTLQLLDAYGEDYYNRGKGSRHLLGKLLYMSAADIKILKIALKTKPDLYLSFGTPYPNQVAWLMRKPGINFQDTENAGLMFAVTRPFSRVYCTPRCFKKDLGKKHIRFNGYMELAYLHPHYFTPDDSIYKYLGISRDEKYVVMRFVSWSASHDIGHKGISLEMKRKAVEQFSKFAQVFISSEVQLPEDMKPYQINIPPEKMHDVLAYASLLYGESATMASECAVLGTPAIYLDNNGRGYTDEEEKKYSLVFNYTESIDHQERSIQKAVEFLKTPHLNKEWQQRRQKMLNETIDVSAFMVWLIENYPKSVTIMKENADYQNRFKNRNCAPQLE